MSFRFREFVVYKDAKRFARSVVNLTRPLTGREKEELASQIRRAAVSVVLNIAEGSDKGSDRDFNRYIRMSLGSLNETVAGLDFARECGYITVEQFKAACGNAEDLARQLGGFSKKLSSS